MNNKEFDEIYAKKRLDTESYSLSHFMDTFTNWEEFNKTKDLKIIHRVREMQATIRLLEDYFKRGVETFEDFEKTFENFGNLKSNFYYRIVRKNILKFRDKYGYNP